MVLYVGLIRNMSQALIFKLQNAKGLNIFPRGNFARSSRHLCPFVGTDSQVWPFVVSSVGARMSQLTTSVGRGCRNRTCCYPFCSRLSRQMWASLNLSDSQVGDPNRDCRLKPRVFVWMALEGSHQQRRSGVGAGLIIRVSFVHKMMFFLQY